MADRSSLTLSVSSGYIKIEEVECGGDFSLDSDQMLRTGYCDVASSREYLPIRSRDKRCRINRPTEPEVGSECCVLIICGTDCGDNILL